MLSGCAGAPWGDSDTPPDVTARGGTLSPDASRPDGSTPAAPAPPKPDGPPDIPVDERLERLEEDVAALQITLSRITPLLDRLAGSGAGPAPARARIPLPSSAARASAARPARATPSTVAASSDGRAPSTPMGRSSTPDPEKFALHLASYRSLTAARAGWRTMRNALPDTLGRLTPVVSQVDLPDKGEFYRLKAGPFADWKTASTACASVKTRAPNCNVLDFGGRPLDLESAKRGIGG